MALAHTFVLNLDHQTSRLAAIHDSLTKVGVPYTRIPGVYGDRVKDRNEVCNVVCTNGMIGCYKAHVNAWTAITVSGDGEGEDTDVFMVLEDDSRVRADTMAIVSEAIAQQKSLGFDILSLWNPMQHFPKACTDLQGSSYKVCMHPLLVTTSGYLMTRAGARKILDVLGERPRYHVDVCMLYAMWMNKITYFCVSPNAIDVDGFHDSSIVGSVSGNYASYLLGVPVFSIRQRFDVSVRHLLIIHMLVLFVGVLQMRVHLRYWRTVAIATLVTILVLIV
jgi:GR25 family glycosyltransferase involved in LPS biosynthesis